VVAAKLRTFLCTPNKTLLALPSVAGTLTRGLTHFVRILAHVLAPQSLALGIQGKPRMGYFFWFITLILVVMSVISSEGITESTSDLIIFVLLSTWAPVLFALLHSALGKNKNFFQFVFASAFTAVAGTGIYILSLASMQVLKSGPLEASGMIFVALPLLYFKYAFYGTMFGALAFLVVRLFEKYA